MSKPKLSIIIVNWNTKDLLRDCLTSINQTKEELALEVIVVDNGSTDGSVQLIKSEFLDVKLIANKENLGFAKANNQGIRKAGGDYMLLLNSDTELKPKALSNLVNFASKEKKAAVVGPKLLNPAGPAQLSTRNLPTISRAVKEYWLGQKGAYDGYVPSGNKAIEVEAVVGAAMLIPKKVIDQVGLLDERYFFYYEDLDFCRRVRRAGFKVYYLPTAEIIHYHGASGRGLAEEKVQWRRLVPSSKIYHGVLGHHLLTAVIWLGQKWQNLRKTSPSKL